MGPEPGSTSLGLLAVLGLLFLTILVQSAGDRIERSLSLELLLCPKVLLGEENNGICPISTSVPLGSLSVRDNRPASSLLILGRIKEREELSRVCQHDRLLFWSGLSISTVKGSWASPRRRRKWRRKSRQVSRLHLETVNGDDC